MTETALPEEAIDARVKFLLDDVHTFFPGTIVSVRPTGLIDIQPNLKVIFPGTTEEVELPVINKVVLIEPRSEGAISRFPKEDLVGTKVGIIISEHSLVEWRQKGGISSLPEEARRFDINDAVAILGLYPETKPWPTEQKPKTLEIQVKVGSKISIGDNNPIPALNAELLNILYNLVTNMLIGVNPSTGLFTNAAKIVQLQTLLAQITNITLL